MEQTEVFDNHLEKRKELSKYIFSLNRQEDAHWCLNSRSVWLKLWDQNMIFFYKQAKVRENKNRVYEINSRLGEKLSSFQEIKDEAFLIFNMLYLEDGVLDNRKLDRFLEVVPTVIESEQNEAMTKKIEEDEVTGTIWDLEPDKALGPGGFWIHFFLFF